MVDFDFERVELLMGEDEELGFLGDHNQAILKGAVQVGYVGIEGKVVLFAQYLLFVRLISKYFLISYAIQIIPYASDLIIFFTQPYDPLLLLPLLTFVPLQFIVVTQQKGSVDQSQTRHHIPYAYSFNNKRNLKIHHFLLLPQLYLPVVEHFQGDHGIGVNVVEVRREDCLFYILIEVIVPFLGEGGGREDVR